MQSNEPLRIAGYAVEKVAMGAHTLGKVVIDENVIVLFRMNDTGDGPAGPSPECTACKITKIRGCADRVCPPIKAQDPNASCSDAITDCARAACAECQGSGSGGDIWILA